MMQQTIEIIGILCSVAVVWGVNQADIKSLKKEIEEYKKHGERLAVIESKLDLILKKYQ